MEDSQKEIDVHEEYLLMKKSNQHQREAMSEVLPFLFVCGIKALTPENFKKYNVTHHLNAASEFEPMMLFRSLGLIFFREKSKNFFG